jgi:hypothetical protein
VHQNFYVESKILDKGVLLVSKHLRTAVEQLKQFYITKIIDAGHHGETAQELMEFTVSELEAIYKNKYHSELKNLHIQ